MLLNVRLYATLVLVQRSAEHRLAVRDEIRATSGKRKQHALRAWSQRAEAMRKERGYLGACSLEMKRSEPSGACVACD